MLWGGGHDGDGITLKASVGVWVHNNDLFYGEPGADADQVKGDGSMDLKDDSQFVTISYNHFWDSGKSSLCGMKKETGPNYISYHHNWFDHSDSRHPRIRSMSVHVYNNYYDGCFSYGVGVTYNGEAFVENNYFRNVKYPMLISLQGSDKQTGGTFSGENGGLIKSFGNVMKSQKSFITYDKNKVEFDAYEVAKRNDKVPINVVGKVGGKTYSNFDTNISIMYTYTADNANDVPTLVMNSAGRAQKGDFTFTFSASDDDTKKANPNLMAKLKAYKTGVVTVGI
jgi:pectate lyase